MRTRLLTLLFVANGVATIVFGELGFSLAAFITKVMIIPFLLTIFFVNLQPPKDKHHLLMAAGLVFSWFGDILLEFTGRNENMFLFGLASFMVAQLIYMYVFFATPGKNSLASNRKLLLIPPVVSAALLISFLYNDLGPMRLPVILYAMAIMAMVTGAINRIEKVNRESFYLVLSGAVLFLISDSTIAINKFSYKFELSSIVVMSTYIVAQYLITVGYIKQYMLRLK
jgi:uncharacterized membrane protein YhhN